MDISNGGILIWCLNKINIAGKFFFFLSSFFLHFAARLKYVKLYIKIMFIHKFLRILKSLWKNT